MRNFRQIKTSFQDPNLEWIELPLGPYSAKVLPFYLGEEGDPVRPTVLLVKYPPNWEMPAHSHPTDYCSIVVGGSIQVGKRWHHTGSVRFVKADTIYGPLKTGDEECDVVDVFADRSGVLGRIADGAGDSSDFELDASTRDTILELLGLSSVGSTGPR